MLKTIHQLKAGDIVRFHGARFEVLHDAEESGGHRPRAGNIEVAHGPSACAYARAVCLDGLETPGYIEHGREWTFQGNHLAAPVEVE